MSRTGSLVRDGRSVLASAVFLAVMGLLVWTAQAAAASDLSIELESPTQSHLKLCPYEEERLFVAFKAYAVSWLGFRRVDRGPVVVDLQVDSDGSALYSGSVSYVIVPVRWEQPGRHEVHIRPRPPAGAGLDGASVQDATIFVDVVECRYEVQTRAIVHITDGGFQPVMGSTIDTATLEVDPLEERRFKGEGTMTNQAVAFPRGGCRPTFTVSDMVAHLVGDLSEDGTSLRLGIVWRDGSAGMSGTGVRCGRVAGGTGDPFKVRPVSLTLPAWGTMSSRAQPVPFTVTSRGKRYTGSMYVTLTRVKP